MDECLPRSGECRNWSVIAKGQGVSFGNNKNILKQIVVTDAQLSEYILKATEVYTLNW